MTDPDLPPLDRDLPLAPLTSWRIGGPALYAAEPDSAVALAACARFAQAQRLPLFALGGGSNILFSDEGYAGLIIRPGTRTWKVVPRGDEATVEAGARTPLATLARSLAAEGWAGLEWAEGIPGTVGGAVIGNAGAYGGEIAGVCLSVTAWSPGAGRREIEAAELRFAYRSSAFSGQDPTREFLLATTFRVGRDDPERLRARVREIATERKARTPAGRSCGSVFRNPPGEAAGRLIERAGLKGRAIGGAQISPQHANYILNTGGATAADVRALIDLARREVARQFGIELRLEVRLAGFADT